MLFLWLLSTVAGGSVIRNKKDEKGFRIHGKRAA
jgi:hypothetical protein